MGRQAPETAQRNQTVEWRGQTWNLLRANGQTVRKITVDHGETSGEWVGMDCIWRQVSLNDDTNTWRAD